MTEQTVTVDIETLSIEDVIVVARGSAKAVISDKSKHGMVLSRMVIDHLADDTVPHHGISTGFGTLASISIPKEQRTQLQKSLIRSHAAGAGPEMEREMVCDLLVLRLSILRTGRTGVRPKTMQVYADMLNTGITPVIYEYGSLGCFGSLAPFAACVLVVMGEGGARSADGLRISGGEALHAAGITPADLREKERLTLVSGIDGMLGTLCMAITDLHLLLKTADVAAVTSMEDMLGSDHVFATNLRALCPHHDQGDSAANITYIFKDFGLIKAGRPDSTMHVQDAYSLRCAPQVHDAARDTVEYAAFMADVELISTIDNPCVTLDGRVESNDSFHGVLLVYVLDFLVIPTADVASVSERRTDRFLDVVRDYDLPAFLAGDLGVDSGFMTAQYTTAGIVSEVKRNAVPAPVDSISSSAMQEDHVSVGWGAVRKLHRSTPAFACMLAVELLCSCRSFDFREPYRPDTAGSAVYHVVRKYANETGPDVRDIWTTPQTEGVTEAILSDEAFAAVESAVDVLK